MSAALLSIRPSFELGVWIGSVINPPEAVVDFR